MEYLIINYKINKIIINLLDSTTKQSSKFRTKNWIEKNDITLKIERIWNL